MSFNNDVYLSDGMGVLIVNGTKYAVRVNKTIAQYDSLPTANISILSGYSPKALEVMSKKFNVPGDGGIKDVIFHYPATIVLWNDGTKTVVKCQPGDVYDTEKGLALCIAKKYFGNKDNFNNVFKKCLSKDKTMSVDIKDTKVNLLEEIVSNVFKNFKNLRF